MSDPTRAKVDIRATASSLSMTGQRTCGPCAARRAPMVLDTEETERVVPRERAR